MGLVKWGLVFKNEKYRAIFKETVSKDLREKWRLIYVDREKPNRQEEADRFYEDNKNELLRGSKVLWEDVRPLYELMKWKWDNGSKAFNTEYMNNPIDEESMIFNPDNFTYWDDEHSRSEEHTSELQSRGHL